MVKEQQKVTDLRSALAVLSHYDDELIYTDEPVDPIAELSGVYRYVGAHGTVQRPTRVGPAMIFNKVKGYDDVKVLIGLLCSRKRVARLLAPRLKTWLLCLKIPSPILLRRLLFHATRPYVRKLSTRRPILTLIS